MAKFTEADIKRAVAGAKKGGGREVRVVVTDKDGRRMEVFATLSDVPVATDLDRELADFQARHGQA
jgi:hypothetical protein